MKGEAYQKEIPFEDYTAIKHNLKMKIDGRGYYSNSRSDKCKPEHRGKSLHQAKYEAGDRSVEAFVGYQKQLQA